MIFDSEYQISIPNQDILTFLFSQTPFKESDPVWLDANNPTSNVTLSRAQELTQQIGQGLRDLGIGAENVSEDIVLTFVENQIMVAPTLFGVLCAGGIHATCPMTATVYELTRQIKMSRPKILICSDQTRTVAEEAISSSLLPVRLLVMVSCAFDVVEAQGKSIVSRKKRQWERITDKETLETRTACLVYSSGTTGPPKGVRITHFNIVANLMQMAFHFNYYAKKAISEGRYLRMPGIMQNAVVLGITGQTMLAVQCGMQVYMFKSFDFPFFVQCIENYQLSTFFLVPAIWNRLVTECSPGIFKNVRFAMSGASALPLALQLKVQEMLPNGLQMRVNWGMTETTTAATQPAPEEKDREGSVGRLLPNLQAIILGSDGKMLGVGEKGELCVKGPNIIREYYENPEATKGAFTSDGWFRSGDLAYVSKKGKFFIVGRLKELLKYKSHQISPTELEAVLSQHAEVRDVGVIGIPDGKENDLPRAYIVPKSPNVTERDIHEFLNSRVSTYKRLRGGVYFVKEIPRNHNSKIMRNVLKKWAEKPRQDTPMAKL